MIKRVLIMCTGNSCRSIIGEALINSSLKSVKAYSCGVNPSGIINPNAKKVLQKYDIWNDDYRSKDMSDIVDIGFDLVVTVCDSAKESCPIFSSIVNDDSKEKSFRKGVKTIHVGFVDPDGKEYSEFEKTYSEMKQRLLFEVKEALG